MEQLSFNQNMAFHPATVASAQAISAGQRPASMRRPAGGSAAGHSGLGDNVTEIILPEGQVENFQLLLPMLTQLNQEKRWLAWIDPPQALVSKWQKMHGIITGELLVLRSTAEYPARQLAEIALSAGTCHAVVMWTGKLGKTAFASLQEAAAKGNSHGVVLRQR